MINVGIIGLGTMGLQHAQVLSPMRGCNIVAAADPITAGRKHFAKLHPSVSVHDNHRDLLNDMSIDAVIVTVPTLHHEKITIAALRTGRPVLCEKPLARTVAAARRMIEAARNARKLLMVGHCRRFDKDWGRFAQIVRQGKLGRPILWRAIAAGRGPGGWFMDDRLGGGPMFDAAVHNYDFANMLFGDPVEVHATAIKLDHTTAIDTATATVHYPKGDQLLISWSWAVSAGRLADAIGPKGGLVFNPPAPARQQSDDSANPRYELTTGNAKSKLIRFGYNIEAMYAAQDRHFLDCIAGQASCQAPSSEAIKAVAVAEAILKAAPRSRTRKVVW